MSVEARVGEPPAAARAHPSRTVAIVALGSLAYAISQTMVIPALPEIQRVHGATAADTGWVMSAFFISSAVSTGIGGRLGDMFGKKRALLCTLLVYVAGAGLCAVSGSLLALIAGRVIMGGGGGIVPLAYSIARDETDGPRVSVALGTIAMTIGLGAGVGMVLGGVIVDHAGYHWSFVLAAAVSVAALAAAFLWVPESRLRTRARVDWVGAALLSAGLGGVLLAISRANVWGWLSPRTLGLAAVGLVVLAVLLAVELRKPQPLLHVPTLLDRPVLSTNLASMAMGAGQIAVSVLVVQYAQVPVAGGGLGESATRASLFLLPYAATMVTGAQVAGRVAWRFGGRAVLIAGATVATLGLLALAAAPTEALWLCALPAVSGFGISMTLVAAPLILAGTVRASRTAEVNGMNTIARNVGQSLGAQLTATVLAAHVLAGSANLPTADGFTVAFVLSGVACASAIVAGLCVPGPSRRGGRVPSGVGVHGPSRRAVAGGEGDDPIGDVPVDDATGRAPIG